MPQIGYLNPRQGGQRNSDVRQKLMRLAQQNLQRSRSISRFSKTGPSKGLARGAAQRGQPILGRATRAAGIMNFLQPRDRPGAYFEAPRFLSADAPGQSASALPTAQMAEMAASVASPLAGSPASAFGLPGETPITPSEAAALQGETSGLNAAIQSSMLGSSPGATLADIVPGYQAPASYSPLSQVPSGQVVPENYGPSPASPVTFGSAGLIPLGGGMFIDPSTGAIHGGTPAPQGAFGSLREQGRGGGGF